MTYKSRNVTDETPNAVCWLGFIDVARRHGLGAEQEQVESGERAGQREPPQQAYRLLCTAKLRHEAIQRGHETSRFTGCREALKPESTVHRPGKIGLPEIQAHFWGGNAINASFFRGILCATILAAWRNTRAMSGMPAYSRTAAGDPDSGIHVPFLRATLLGPLSGGGRCRPTP